MCHKASCNCAQQSQATSIEALQSELDTIYHNLQYTVRPMSAWDINLLEAELSQAEKRAFRSQMKTGRDRSTTGDWYEQCKKNNNGKCELHHIIPLQYTHLFKKNIALSSHSKHHPNHVKNLVLVGQKPHDHIHSIINKQVWPIYEKYGVPKNKTLATGILSIATQAKRDAFQKELKAALTKAKAETLAYVRKHHVQAFVPAGFQGKVLKEIFELTTA